MEEEVVLVCYFLSVVDVLWVPHLFVLVQLGSLMLVYFVHVFPLVELLHAQKYRLISLGRLHGVLCFHLVPLVVLAMLR